jgi:hypothetical protein
MAKVTKEAMAKMLRLHHARVSNFGEPRRKEGRTISAHTKAVLDAALAHHDQMTVHAKAAHALVSSLLVGSPPDVKAEIERVLATWKQAQL